MGVRRTCSRFAVACVFSGAAVPCATADSLAPADGIQPAASATSALAPPAPYSLPWLLRPAVPATVVRVDETSAFYDDPASGRSGSTNVTSLIASYKLGPHWAPLARVSFVKNDAPVGASGHGFSNPVLGINYFHPLRDGWRWTALLASSLPIGSGGGDTPDVGAAAAMPAGATARSAMDNTLYAVNYWGLVGGLGLSRIARQLTLQAETTVFQLTRVRGAVSQDKTRTNLTAALHVGHFFGPRLSLGAELRMQRWLTDAAPVRANAKAREQLTFAVGPRLQLKAGDHLIRPGVSYTRAFDDPMAARSYGIVQLDVPVVF